MEPLQNSVAQSYGQLPVGVGALIAGRYEVRRELGRGGMGAVLLAWDAQFGREVAVKLITNLNGPAAQARFERESDALAGLRHPGIVQVYDRGALPNGAPYMVLEFVDGAPLADLIGEELDPREMAVLVAQVAEALQAAHDKGVLHRDIKPDNIMLRNGSGAPVILDFGLTRTTQRGQTLTEEGAMLGTPEYMAPEQVDGQHAGPRTDVYGLGATLYTLLAGRSPHFGPSAVAVVKSLLTTDAAPVRTHNPAVSRALSAVVTQALSRDPEARYEDAGAFAEALRQAVSEPEGEAPRGLGGGMWLAAGLAGALVLGSLAFVLSGRPAPSAEPVAEPSTAPKPPAPTSCALTLDGPAVQLAVYDAAGAPVEGVPGVAPCVLELPFGDYELRLSRPGDFSELRQRASLSQPEARLSYAPPRRERWTARLETNYLWAPVSFAELNGDGVVDLLFNPQIPGLGGRRDEDSRIVAVSGRDGDELWRYDGPLQEWASVGAVQHQRELRVAASQLNDERGFELAWLDKGGRLLKRLPFAKPDRNQKKAAWTPTPLRFEGGGGGAVVVYPEYLTPGSDQVRSQLLEAYTPERRAWTFDPREHGFPPAPKAAFAALPIDDDGDGVTDKVAWATSSHLYLLRLEGARGVRVEWALPADPPSHDAPVLCEVEGDREGRLVVAWRYNSATPQLAPGSGRCSLIQVVGRDMAVRSALVAPEVHSWVAAAADVTGDGRPELLFGGRTEPQYGAATSALILDIEDLARPPLARFRERSFSDAAVMDIAPGRRGFVVTDALAAEALVLEPVDGAFVEVFRWRASKASLRARPRDLDGDGCDELILVDGQRGEVRVASLVRRQG